MPVFMEWENKPVKLKNDVPIYLAMLAISILITGCLIAGCYYIQQSFSLQSEEGISVQIENESKESPQMIAPSSEIQP